MEIDRSPERLRLAFSCNRATFSICGYRDVYRRRETPVLPGKMPFRDNAGSALKQFEISQTKAWPMLMLEGLKYAMF